jgi:glycosyltransferase involved in cell wall biosynthesis
MPSYGGPAYSVARLAVALTEVGIDVGLWAPDGSAKSTTFLPEESRVQRLIGTTTAAVTAFGSPDLIHDNGIWLVHNHWLATLAMKHRIPRIVSTRGMLDPWAMNNKRVKKLVAWALYQRRDLEHADVLHATAELEAMHVRLRDLGPPVCVIPNGVDLPEGRGFGISSRSVDDKETRTALFLGRIYPVKGLPMLVDAWARVRPADWRLRIAGPDEAGHRTEIERAVSASGLRDIISFVGPLDGAGKSAEFRNADLFVLPTHSESFGMAIAEALAHGLPVLTTKGTPWSMLPQRDCGWWVEPTANDIADGLRQATSLQPMALRAMGARGRELVAAEFGWTSVAKAFAKAYTAAIASRSGHEDVHNGN